ncbi:hypothetical protein UA38_11680 [Photobacterium kishitanii]|uniref:Uncharacterized protein n=1 Tax=Photobacterium kishitanii TaxID=318456 RepID=A0AAX0YTP9_9GAMM|nr:hypothetical protein [Photobacterium kishitanii]KJG57029.1 hypothetical protein UA38_11680 [Photobacterium kishitanii]KJG60553.1 hypothetical protein UA42_14465 [Photobacterium kishitanii]KJG64855.1 hypothetical protein UA40_14160 [Photobacterium kishitanii]KJG68491.1 hypothetical protein UA41_16570 [Photobacterium kishitanii]OBU31225.1 hypothetical protein AYY23_20140 [Photobacterium kishitanii]
MIDSYYENYEIATPQQPLIPTVCSVYIISGLVSHVIIRDKEENKGAKVSAVLDEIVSNLIADNICTERCKYYFQQQLSTIILNKRIRFNNNFSEQQFDSINEFEAELLSKAAYEIKTLG